MHFILSIIAIYFAIFMNVGLAGVADTLNTSNLHHAEEKILIKCKKHAHIYLVAEERGYIYLLHYKERM